ncbi:hypothetical protein [Streptomyces sp. NPDC054784]
MNRHTPAAAALAALLLLAGCGNDGDDGGKASKSSSKPEVAQEGVQEPEGDSTAQKKLGTPADTIGDSGTGELQVTPTSVVHLTKAGEDVPDNDVLVVVAIKEKATSAAPAAGAAPAGGGGWTWIAPDGQAIDAGDGSVAFNVVPEGFNGGGDVQPGTYIWASEVFDLTTEQAKSGTLAYVDGSGAGYRWKVPATDTGPEAAKLKAGL